jgi:hypothetical protein
MTLPRDHLIWAQDLGLRTVTYLNKSIEVEGGRKCWLPRDLIAMDGSCCVIWQPADREYNFDGWRPEHTGMFGGRYRTITSAFAWIERAKAVRAGTESNFLGV